MKIESKFKVREIAGEKIIILQETYGSDMTKIISLNDSAELLFNELSGRDFEMEDAAKVLTDNYDVEPQVALADATKWVDSLTECGVIVR